VAVILPAAVALFMVADSGYRIDAPWWIIFNGVVIMPPSCRRTDFPSRPNPKR
jgi:hypothetical protein